MDSEDDGDFGAEERKRGMSTVQCAREGGVGTGRGGAVMRRYSFAWSVS